MDLKKIEKKWQKQWESKKLFEANPAGKKFFTSLIIPYVNGDIHIGHGFTYSRCDCYARFKRMQGLNVLLAQGFHATGEPILGAIERLRKGDKSQIETVKMYGATDSDIENIKKKGPEYTARFWSEKIKQTMKQMGFSIDWRREFITAVEPTFSRFIEWQYNTLKKRGYVTQGTHPVVWCPKCESPTGDHDRLEGEGESPIDYIMLKFPFEDYILPAGTLRPETIYGVTNMWVNPEVEYVKAQVDNEKWIISKECAEKLKDQLKKVKIIGSIRGSELLGKKFKNPVTNNELVILPSSFVDPESATGIVMSVPSHAPYDWIAIKELIDNNELEQYGITKSDIEPISVVETPGYSDHPAIDLCKEMKITSLKQAADLDEATNTLYKKEYHLGVLNKNCGEYSGMRVSECKEKLSVGFMEKGLADVIWDCGRVVCRCTSKCHIKILENQWFLKYSDTEWKNKVKKYMNKMNIYPEEAKTNFINTIDWLKDKACTRKTGLGTPLPWDKSWIVETLSDSTVYMAYYTIARIINEKKISANSLTDEVFDFIFLNKGLAKTIAKKSKINQKLLEELKKEFEYFYPLDIRMSGKDLVQNHLIFFLFQHIAIFPQNKWPKSIAVNGYVNIEKEKMSKSKGNIIPLRDLIDQFGADLVRMNLVTSNEGLDDADWRFENIKSYKSRLEFLYENVKNVEKAGSTKTRNIDLYLQCCLQRNIKNAIENYEITKFRTASHHALFNNMNTLRWYLKRVDGIKNANKKILTKSLESIVKLMAPIAPHISEELWHMLGHKSFVSTEKMPSFDKSAINEDVEQQEDFIRHVISDVLEIQKIAKIQPKKISLFIAEDWKFSVYNTVLKKKEKGINEITKEIMSTGKYGKATIGFVQSLYKKINLLKPVVQKKRQSEILAESKKFLEKELRCKIEVFKKSDNQKAKAATPQKPGILLE